MPIYKKEKWYTISVVAERYEIHQQTLRLYEREGLLKPGRSKGNTRLYTEADVARLETILSLTRDLGVNLAGVAIILDLQERMAEMQRDFGRALEVLREHVAVHLSDQDATFRTALVPRPRRTEE
jgi:MerR family transcriptional regulator, heat shock protein HspR